MKCFLHVLLLVLFQTTTAFYYYLPVCDRLTPGMKVRMYVSIFLPNWVMQVHVDRAQICYEGAFNLQSDRPFHVNNNFTAGEYALASGSADSWLFTHVLKMQGEIQPNVFFQADILVVEGGFHYYINGKFINDVMTPLFYEKADCIIGTADAIVQYKWIEGQPNCAYRANDTVRPGFEATTLVPPTSTFSPTTWGTLPTPPPYFPPYGWPYCIPPYCYPYITFPCHPLCYTNCPVYCPPACYIIPNYGYQPPPVYPPCNLVNLPTCIPLYGVTPYYPPPIGYVQPQCQYLPGTWPWIINWPPYGQTTASPTSNPTGSTPLTSGTYSWPTSNPTGSTGWTLPSSQSTGGTGVSTNTPTSLSTGSTGGTSWPTSNPTGSTGGTSTWPSTTPSSPSTASTASWPSTSASQSTAGTSASTLTPTSLATSASLATTGSTSLSSTSPATTTPLAIGVLVLCPPPSTTLLYEGEVYNGCPNAAGTLFPFLCIGRVKSVLKVGDVIPAGCLSP